MYEYAIETGTEYLTDLEIHDKSGPLCENIQARFQVFFNEMLLTRQEWEIFSLSLTMVGNHVIISIMLRRLKR